jgi:hypothetical protein
MKLVTTAAARPVDAATSLVGSGFGLIAAGSFVFSVPLLLSASLRLDGAEKPR